MKAEKVRNSRDKSKKQLKAERVMISRIFFAVVMMVAILYGVPVGLAAFMPADWCGATPVEPVVYVLSVVFALRLAYPNRKPGILSVVRLGVTMLVGTLAAVLAAQFVVGCTYSGGWLESNRIMVEAFVMCVILIPLAALHRQFIEPRFSRFTDPVDDAES